MGCRGEGSMVIRIIYTEGPFLSVHSKPYSVRTQSALDRAVYMIEQYTQLNCVYVFCGAR